MRALALCTVLVACGGGKHAPIFPPPPPSLFVLEAGSTDRASVDLDAVDAGLFQFTLGSRTITPTITRTSLPNGTLMQGTFGTRGSLVFARVGATVTGVVREGNVGFEVVPFAGGHRVVPRTWDLPVRPLHGPRWEEIASAAGIPPLQELSWWWKPVVIDVLFAYTPNVLKDRTLDGVWGLANAAIADLNNACAKAGAKAEFRVAGVKPTSDSEIAEDGSRKDIDTIYDELLERKSFKDAHAERKAAHADILVLLIDSVDGGLGVARINATADTAVAVADHHDSLWYLTIPHEIGHIMGGRHDDDTRTKPIPYAHAYVGTDGRTIMSNPCGTPETCPLEVRWSEPPFGDHEERDNARVIRETARGVSKFGDNITD